MNRLLKAESYRFRHSSHIFLWNIFIILLLIGLPFLMIVDAFDMALKDVAAFLMFVGGDALSYIPLILGTFVCVYISLGYVKKLYYYELMNGEKITHIIFSKLINAYLYITIPLLVLQYFVLFLFYLKGGMGELDNVGIRALLEIIIIFHVSTEGLLFGMLGQNLISIVLAFLRFDVLDALLSLLAMNNKSIKGISLISSSSEICCGKIDSALILGIVMSFVIECAILYFLVYIRFKKKQ